MRRSGVQIPEAAPSKKPLHGKGFVVLEVLCDQSAVDLAGTTEEPFLDGALLDAASNSSMASSVSRAKDPALGKSPTT